VIRGELPPAPMPANGDVVLERDSLYVVEADIELLAFVSPGGAIKATKDSGPIRIRAKFADGKGTETRTFAAKHLVIVEAAGEGRDELLIVPVGAKNESEARRVFLRVGQLPRPPPVDPKPDVKPSTSPIKADGLHVLIVYKASDTLPSSQNAILYGERARKLLDEKCVTDARGQKAYRIFPDTVEFGGELAVWKETMARQRQSIPWIVIGNGKDGYEGPLPANVDDFETLVNKYAK
jgi:hypothetical protein